MSWSASAALRALAMSCLNRSKKACSWGMKLKRATPSILVAYHCARLAYILRPGPPAMRYQQFGARYVVRLESGERVVESLSKFLDARGIGFAEISAAGALKALTLGYWNAESQKYQFREFDEQVEVVSF